MSSADKGESPPTDAAADFDQEFDLLQRYEQMVQTQVDTLNGIDDKAAYTARLVGLLSGIILSTVSIVAGTRNVDISYETGALFGILGFAILAFIVALLYAIVTYLSSRFEYGPTAALGDLMADYHVEQQDYKDMLLRGYSDAIRANRTVVVTNARRFERCLASLVVGVLFTTATGVMIVLPPSIELEVATVLVFASAAVLTVSYILQEVYLTLERERVSNE